MDITFHGLYHILIIQLRLTVCCELNYLLELCFFLMLFYSLRYLDFCFNVPGLMFTGSLLNSEDCYLCLCDILFSVDLLCFYHLKILGEHLRVCGIVMHKKHDKFHNSSDKVLGENLTVCPDFKNIIKICQLKNYILRKLFLRVCLLKIHPLKFQKVSYVNFCLRTMDINIIILFKKCYAITKNVILLQKMLCYSKNVMLLQKFYAIKNLLYIIYSNIYKNTMVEIYHMLKYYIQCFWYNKISFKKLSYIYNMIPIYKIFGKCFDRNFHKNFNQNSDKNFGKSDKMFLDILVLDTKNLSKLSVFVFCSFYISTINYIYLIKICHAKNHSKFLQNLLSFNSLIFYHGS